MWSNPRSVLPTGPLHLPPCLVTWPPERFRHRETLNDGGQWRGQRQSLPGCHPQIRWSHRSTCSFWVGTLVRQPLPSSRTQHFPQPPHGTASPWDSLPMGQPRPDSPVGGFVLHFLSLSLQNPVVPCHFLFGFPALTHPREPFPHPIPLFEMPVETGLCDPSSAKSTFREN